MDFKITSKIWSTNLPSGEKTVLLALDHSGDSDGFSWQGYDKLADMTGISKDSKYLTRILNKLEQKGHLLIWRQHGHKGGRGYTHIYWPIIGRTNEEILEIVTRRFIATEEEAGAIISKSGPIYDELIKRNRVSGKILEESRVIKKGVPQYTNKNEKGVLDDPHSKERVLPETPINEDDSKKGVLGIPRLLDSSLESYPNKESLQDSSPYGEGGEPPHPENRENLEQGAEQVEESPPDLTRRKRTKTPREPANIPEAVKVYRTIAHLYPDKALWTEIAETVGDKPEDLQLWRDVVYGYISSGYHKRNIKQMLGYFRRREIPTTEKQNGAIKNGHYGNSTSKSTAYGTQSEKRTGEDSEGVISPERAAKLARLTR